MSGTRRGFIFTADAIFSLIMILAVAVMFAVFSNQPEYSARTTLVQSLAYDYLSLSQPPANLTSTTFANDTGLIVSTSTSSIPGNAPITAYAVMYAYNSSCFGQNCTTGCTFTNAQANGSGSCLTGPASVKWGTIKTEAWVST